jgi:hypothetical protein
VIPGHLHTNAVTILFVDRIVAAMDEVQVSLFSSPRTDVDDLTVLAIADPFGVRTGGTTPEGRREQRASSEGSFGRPTAGPLRLADSDGSRFRFALIAPRGHGPVAACSSIAGAKVFSVGRGDEGAEQPNELRAIGRFEQAEETCVHRNCSLVNLGE